MKKQKTSEAELLGYADVIERAAGKGYMAIKGKKMNPPIHKGCVCTVVPEEE